MSHQDLLGENLDLLYRSGIQYRDVQLSDAQIKALPTTLVELVPPAGPQMLLFHRAFLYADMPGAIYSNVSETGLLFIDYGTPSVDEMGASVAVSTKALLAPVPPRSPQFTTLIPKVEARSVTSIYSIQAVDIDDPVGNQYPTLGLVLGANNAGADVPGDFTGGDPANTLSIRVWYSIVPAVPFGA